MFHPLRFTRINNEQTQHHFKSILLTSVCFIALVSFILKQDLFKLNVIQYRKECEKKIYKNNEKKESYFSWKRVNNITFYKFASNIWTFHAIQAEFDSNKAKCAQLGWSALNKLNRHNFEYHFLCIFRIEINLLSKHTFHIGWKLVESPQSNCFDKIAHRKHSIHMLRVIQYTRFYTRDADVQWAILECNSSLIKVWRNTQFHLPIQNARNIQS